jgi:hypothetical protein
MRTRFNNPKNTVKRAEKEERWTASDGKRWREASGIDRVVNYFPPLLDHAGANEQTCNLPSFFNLCFDFILLISIFASRIDFSLVSLLPQGLSIMPWADESDRRPALSKMAERFRVDVRFDRLPWLDAGLFRDPCDRTTDVSDAAGLFDSRDLLRDDDGLLKGLGLEGHVAMVSQSEPAAYLGRVVV